MRQRSSAAEGSAAPSAIGSSDLDVRRLVSAFDSLRDAAIVVDEDGTEIVRNLEGERYRDARHGDAIAQHAIEALLARALEGTAGEDELSLFGPPREVLQMWAVPLRQGAEEIIGAAVFVRDVTEARRVESIRRDFVANVSHELKTPVGALGLLAETITESDDPEVTGALAERMVREAERLGRIVDDLLDLSMLEAQEGPTRERSSVRVLLDEAVDRLAPMALANAITLRTAAVADDLTIVCDPGQVISALTNLLDNAIKYSEEGDTVVLAAERAGDRVVISVTDEGVGIPSSDLERVFERFYRVDRARSRGTGGTGLGLSIVRNVAQVHGGDVTVESVEGEGSTFWIALPSMEHRPEEAGASPPPSEQP